MTSLPVPDSKFDSQLIFCVRNCDETVECELNKGGCGETQDRYEYHKILKFAIKETSEYEQSKEQLLNTANLDFMHDYRCEIDPSRSCVLNVIVVINSQFLVV